MLCFGPFFFEGAFFLIFGTVTRDDTLLSLSGIRKRGIAMYVNAPVLARDNAFGWFPAQIVKVNEAKGTLKIHYNGASWLEFWPGPLGLCFPSYRARPPVSGLLRWSARCSRT